MLNVNSTIFKTITSSVDESRKTLALFNKDWNTYKTNWQNANGIGGKIGSIFASSNAGTSASVISNDQVQILRNWNNAVKHGCTDQATFNRIIANADENTKMYFAGLNKGKGSIEGLKNAQKVATQSTIGLTIAQTALNMAITMGITALVSIIAKGYDELANSVENCKERVDDLMSSYKSALDTANNNASRVEELADKYEDLSKGVNSLGENISLTNEEYKEYNSLVNEIAEMFPTLVQGYTDEGNAILNLKGNVEELRDAYKEAQQEAYNLLIASGEDTDGNDIIKQWEDTHDTGFWASILDLGADDVGGGISVADALEQLRAIQQMSADEYREIERITGSGSRKEIAGLTDIEKEIGYGSYLYKALGLNSNSTDEEFREAQRQAKALIQTYNAEIEAALSDVETLANAYLMTNEDYDKLDAQSKSAASMIVNSLNADIANGFSSKEDVATYVDKIVQTILADDKSKLALTDLFTMDTSDMSINEIKTQVDSYINIIATALKEDPIELKTRLGFDYVDELEAQYQRAVDYAKDKFKSKPIDITPYQEALDDEYQKIQDWGLEDYADKIKNGTIQSVFGNIDMDKRTIITWSDELKQTYADALSSWDYDPEVGSIDTVFGGSNRFGEELNGVGWEVAFTPILPDGTFLSQDAVYDYINTILEEAYANDGKVTEDELVAIDAQGRQIGNTFVHGIFAGIDDSQSYDNNGNWAETVGRLMHFSGDFGAVQIAKDAIEKAKKQESDFDWDSWFKENSINTQEEIDRWNEIAESATNAAEARKKYTEGEEDDKTSILSFSDAWEQLKNSTEDATKGLADELTKLAEAGQLTAEALIEADTSEFFKNAGISAEEATKQINALVSSSTQLNALSGQIAKMSDMLADKKNKKTASANDLAGFDAEVRGLDSWKEFEKVMGSTTSTMEECQAAADALATEWVNNGNFLANLTDENKDYYITQMSNMGIENASAIVTDVLTQKKQALALATEFATAKGKDLSNATFEEINAFIDENEIVGEARNALYRLALAKQGVNAATLSFDGDITNIKNYVKALGGAAYALSMMEQIKNNPSASIPSEARNQILKQAQIEVETVTNTPADVGLSDLGSFGYKPSGSSGDTSKQKEEKPKTGLVDFYEKKINSLNNQLDVLGEKYENIFSVKKKKDNLDEQIDKLKELSKVSDTAAKRYRKQADKITFFKDPKKDAEFKEKIRNGSYNITRYDQDTINKIQRYEDYIGKAEDAESQSRTAKTQEREKRIEQYQLDVNNAEAKIAKSQALAALQEGNYKNQNKHLEGQKKYYEESYAAQIKIAEEEKDAFKVTQLRAELAQKLRDIEKEEFDNVVSTYEYKIGHIKNQLDDITNAISDVENRGLIADSTFYTAQIDVQNKIKDQLETEHQKLKEQLKDIKDFTPAWYNALNSIQDVENEIANTNSAIKELQNSINGVANTLSGNILDSFQDLNSEADTLITLLGDNLSDDKLGNLTNNGIAALGLYSQQMNVSKASAERVQNEINSIQKAIDNGTYGNFVDSNGMLRTFASTYEAEDRIKELYSTYRSEIQSTYQYESKIVDLMKQKYQSELAYVNELIDQKTSLLDAEKSLYDYAQSIKQESDNINSLRKQIVALQGDSSKEATAKIQRLQKQLKDSEQSLQDKQYDRYVSDQKEMLSNLSKEYSELIESVSKDRDTLLKEGNQLISANGAEIQQTINETASEYGMQLTDNMQSATANITTGLSGIKTVLDTIAQHVAGRIVGTDGETHDVNAGGAKNDAISKLLSSGTNTKPSSKLTKAIGEAYGVGLNLQQIADLSRLLGLNYELKDFTNESPIHNQAKLDILNELEERKYLKKSGNSYIRGYAGGGVISSVANAIRLNGDKVLISGKPGERMLTEKQNENFEKFTDALPDLVNLTDIIKPNVNVPTAIDRNIGDVTYGGNNQITIELPSVTNYEDFMRKFQNDPKAEQLVQHMTASALNGSRLGKNTIRF